MRVAQLEERPISAPPRDSGRREAFGRRTALSAWPFVIVIFTQMAVGGFSVYTLSAIRAFITGESLWSKGQHEAVYFIDLYLDSHKPQYLDSFKRTIAVPLSYREGRQHVEARPMEAAAAGRAFVAGGTAAADIPAVLWLFRHFRGFPYLEEAISRWKETDHDILELKRLGDMYAVAAPTGDPARLRDRVEEIDAAITPRTIAFSRALDDGARVVETLLLLVNFVLAGMLAALTIWRVSKVSSQRRAFEDALAWQATHDELTGTANRRTFEEGLKKALTLGKSEPSATCALMFIDLDQFKIINDTCGHAAGDAVLRRIGPLLQTLLGAEDLLARLGGDEFGILMRRADMARALAVAEAVRAAVESFDFVWKGRRFPVTASIGLVQDRPGAVSPAEMMAKADIACLMAKEKGRNRVHLHRKEDRELRGRLREMNWVQRIQHALDEDRLCLHAQEIVALDGGDEAGVHLEVLVRMRDETGGLVPPSSFLPAAERFGLTKAIDRWVVRRAFRTLVERRSLPDVAPITCCGINLSGAAIGDGAFLDFLKSAFDEFAIPPNIICFEVTETTAIVNLEAARAFIRELRALGCSFALDDFGSGMSSFNYLKELPVEFLKIDGGFVRNLLIERSDRAMVEMINHVGHVMGKQIIAEFVETQEVAEALREIGIDFAQGYGIASPVPFTARFESLSRAARKPVVATRRLIA